jgi:hypothetical protein
MREIRIKQKLVRYRWLFIRSSSQAFKGFDGHEIQQDLRVRSRAGECTGIIEKANAMTFDVHKNPQYVPVVSAVTHHMNAVRKVLQLTCRPKCWTYQVR